MPSPLAHVCPYQYCVTFLHLLSLSLNLFPSPIYPLWLMSVVLSPAHSIPLTACTPFAFGLPTPNSIFLITGPYFLPYKFLINTLPMDPFHTLIALNWKLIFLAPLAYPIPWLVWSLIYSNPLDPVPLCLPTSFPWDPPAEETFQQKHWYFRGIFLCCAARYMIYVTFLLS